MDQNIGTVKKMGSIPYEGDDFLLSIVIPCFNDYSHIATSVNSALKQTWVNKEIIVVDDGSDDGTKRVLNTFKPNSVKIITQSNQGPSAARNRGIEAANGKYILVLDSDDYFEPEFSRKAIKVFLKDSDVKIVTCYSRWFDDRTSRIFKSEGGTIKDVLISNVAMGSSMFRKQDWQLVGGYDKKMDRGYEDWEFYMRLLKSGGKAEVIPEILFNYRNKNNSRNKKANRNKHEILEYIYLKHSDIYKEHFDFFIHQWLKSIRKSEAFKQQVMDSIDYKIGHKLLKPLRLLGLFKKTNNS